MLRTVLIYCTMRWFWEIEVQFGLR